MDLGDFSHVAPREDGSMVDSGRDDSVGGPRENSIEYPGRDGSMVGLMDGLMDGWINAHV